MSVNKRYYWLKLKKDFFDTKMIKILKKFDKGNEIILTFLKIELHSLENDGYIYFENMLPTFEQELAIAIDEDIEIVKETLNHLIRFKAIEKKDENTYYITAIEDCIGSETDSARKMRKHRESQCDHEVAQCYPEKEKEKEKKIDIEKEKKPSAFSAEKKAEGYAKINKTKNNKEPQKHNSAARANPPRNYEMEAYLEKMKNQAFSSLPEFMKPE